MFSTVLIALCNKTWFSARDTIWISHSYLVAATHSKGEKNNRKPAISCSAFESRLVWRRPHATRLYLSCLELPGYTWSTRNGRTRNGEESATRAYLSPSKPRHPNREPSGALANREWAVPITSQAGVGQWTRGRLHYCASKAQCCRVYHARA